MSTENKPIVLCVDDDPRTLEILSKVLDRLPVEPVLAQGTRQAADLAQRLQPRLIILDVTMPEVSGWQLLQTIRGSHPRANLRVLALSAKANSAERSLATNVARIDAFMGKPFDIAELARRVAALLELPPPGEWSNPGVPGPAGPE